MNATKTWNTFSMKSNIFYQARWFINLYRSISIFMVTIFLNSCTSNKYLQVSHDEYFKNEKGVQTGGIKMIPVKVPSGKTYNVWTKRIGNNPKIKVLLLAGGPGMPHDYLEAFESFFPGESIEFYYYDELGSGNSDKPNEPSRLSISSAVEEVEQVRKALKLDKENFYLYGHSWGGALAMEYTLKYQKNIKALIVSNMPSSGKEFNRYIQEVLVKQIDPKVMDSINELAGKNDYGNPKYMELVIKHFYSKFVCRIPVESWPDPVNRAISKVNAPYYMELQGPSEFGFLGTLKDWDVSKKLEWIHIPTLMIGAKYDEMDPEHMKWMSEQVQYGSYLYCANGSHLSMYDEQEFYMKGIISFIRNVEKEAQ